MEMWSGGRSTILLESNEIVPQDVQGDMEWEKHTLLVHLRANTLSHHVD